MFAFQIICVLFFCVFCVLLRMVTDEPGTYLYWETAPSTVGARGLYGAFVILEEHPNIQENESEVVVLSDFFRMPIGQLLSRSHGRLSVPATSSPLKHRVGFFPLDTILINGFSNTFSSNDRTTNGTTSSSASSTSSSASSTISNVLYGSRLRLMNTAAVFAFKVSLELHAFDVVASDGSPVVPFRCIAVLIAPGERFDVEIVDPLSGRFEFKVETLEENPRYSTSKWALSNISASTSSDMIAEGQSRQEGLRTLPIINCFDVAEQSNSCLPVSVLRSSNPPLRPLINEKSVVWELVMRATSASGIGHFVRLRQGLALDDPHESDHWKSRYLSGNFVQHALTSLPVLYKGSQVLHPHSVVLEALENEWVDVVFNAIDRQAVPWHLSGHKFLVLGLGHANPNTDCNLLRCESPWYGEDTNIYHNGQDFLSDGGVGIWKDTIIVPPGGWAVVRFRARVGWWSLSSSSEPLANDGYGILVHVTNGLVNNNTMPEAFQNVCDTTIQATEISNCSCREDPGMVFDAGPRSSYKCSRPHLCQHVSITNTRITQKPSLTWRIFYILLAIVSFFCLYRVKILRKRQQIKQLDEVNATPTSSPKSGSPSRELSLSAVVPMADSSLLVVPTMPGQANTQEEDEVSNAGSACNSLAMSTGSLRARRGSFGRKRESVTQRAESLCSFRSFILDSQNDMRLVWAGLTVSQGGNHIMDGVAGSMNPGEMLAVIGPSGSGKTLLLNLLAGTRLKNEAKLTDGAILFGGTPFHSYSSEALRSLRSFLGEDQMQYAASGDSSMGGFTVFELLTFYAQLQKPREDLADAIIESYVYEGIIHVGLEGCAGRRIHSLSSSQRRRVALCAELLFPRPILLLDGAFLGLDVNSKMNLTLWCQEIALQCGAIIIMTISSPPSKVLPLFNKLLILQRGGYPVYFGPTEKAPDYFDGMRMRVPPLWNPSGITSKQQEFYKMHTRTMFLRHNCCLFCIITIKHFLFRLVHGGPRF